MADAGNSPVDTAPRLAALRKLMLELEGGPLDAYLVPSEDAHQSEYVALCDQRRAFISGFTGSAGLALVTPAEARLWTDGRYFAQAARELGPQWTLMRVMEDPSVEPWIAQNLRPGARVGADFTCLSVDAARRLEHEMVPKGQQLVQVSQNLVDVVWGKWRPAQPLGALRVQPLQYAGVSAADKVGEVRRKLGEQAAHAMVVSALDEVAWLLNIRGADVPYNPVAVAYAIVPQAGQAVLYVDSRKMTQEVSAHLHENGVQVRKYSQFVPDLGALAKAAAAAGAVAATSAKEGGNRAGPEVSLGAARVVEANGREGANGELKDEAGNAEAGEVGGGSIGVGGWGGEESAGGGVQAAGSKVWICPATASLAILGQLKRSLPTSHILQLPSPLSLAKAVKNQVELEGLRAAHVRDGVACVQYFCWLDQQMWDRLGAPGYFAETVEERESEAGTGAAAAAAAAAGSKRKHRDGGGCEEGADRAAAPPGARSSSGGREGAEGAAAEERPLGAAALSSEPPACSLPKGVPLDEVSVADVLEGFRQQQELFMGPSFATISSVGPNAAIIHYKPEKETCARLSAREIYLCDSGGQYLDGTTDVTRTVHFGKPTAHEKRCFTLVLKGYIGLETVIFPNGTTGAVLDVLARTALWREGLDYRHGTGHGVGSYLNVHEGPQLISFRPKAHSVPLQASMTVTDEPGYYEDGQFGIRTENVLVIKEHQCPHNFGGKGYLAMEPLTMVPIQLKLVEASLLLPSELEWLNNYHAMCRTILSPHLSGAALEWLWRATESLP